jgi:YD repeat-containing protein
MLVYKRAEFIMVYRNKIRPSMLNNPCMKKRTFLKPIFKQRNPVAKLVAVLLLCQLSSGLVYSQAAQNNHIPSMPSPTVASLAKYTDFPEIDQFGLAPVTIPIYNLKVGNFTLPLTLSYHVAGVRVAQESSWVGLNFDLRSVCFIARSVRDLPDDMDVPRNRTHAESFLYYGWLSKPEFYKDFPNISWAEGNTDEQKAAHVLSYNDGSPRTGGRRDTQPDIYFLTAGNISEKFIFDHEGKIVFLEPKTRLKVINYVLNDFTKGIREFVIADNDGNTYYFGSENELNAEIEETTVESAYRNNMIMRANWSLNTVTPFRISGGMETQTYRTAWFLRKVEVQSNNESITFSYQEATEEFDVPLDKFKIRQTESGDPQDAHPILQGIWSGLLSVKHTSKTYYLKEIETDNIVVDFSLSDRTDLKGAKKLDKVTVTAFNNVIEECTFSYLTKKSKGTEDDFALSRLFLHSATLKGKPSYVFYYSSIMMPHKRSHQQDFWGFTCLKSTSLIPKLYVYPDRIGHLRYSCFPIVNDDNYKELEGSDRSMDEASLLAGSLQRVKLPSGGYDEIILEPNEFYDEHWGQIKGGGLRIKEIRKLDANFSVVQKKAYTYTVNNKSSGKLLNGLAFAVPTTYSIPSSHAIMYHLKANDPDVWDYFTLRKSSNYFPLVNHDGALVAYTNVSIVETGNGKIEKVFYPEKSFLNNATPVKWAKPYTRYNVFSKDADLYVDIKKRVEINLLSYGLSKESESVWVDLEEHVDGKRWSTNGVVGFIDYYFYYKNERVKYVGNGFSYPLVIFNTEDADVPIGQIQKTGTNIYPFPPISDDGNVNAGKLKEIKYFKENDLNNPVQHTTYTYKAIGTPTTIYGLVFGSHYICNKTLTPLPHEKNWFTSHSYNAQYFVEKNMGMYYMPKAWAKYTIIADQSYEVASETIIKSGVTKTTDFTYNDNLLIKEQSENTSEGAKLITKYKYPDDYTYVNDANAVNRMKDRNIGTMYIERQVIHQKAGVSKVISAELNEYKIHNNLIVIASQAAYKPNTYDPVPMTSSINSNGDFVADSRYVTEVTFDKRDDKGNLLHYTGINKMPISIIWGYNDLLPVAEVKNAKPDQIAYTSFESDDTGYFTYVTSPLNYSDDAKTGRRGYVLYSKGKRNDLSRTLPAGEYIVSYWAKGTGQITVHNYEPISVSAKWTYYEKFVQIPSIKDVVIFGSVGGVVIDEVRIYPASAQMSSFVYDPLIGITSITDTNGIVQYFEYDNAGRLTINRIDVTDVEKGVITKQYQYQYAR